MSSESHELRIALSREERSQRLDQILVAHAPEWSRTRLQALIHAGHASLDGRVVTKPGFVPMDGRELVVALVESAPSGQRRPWVDPRVVHEDAHLIVLDKPAGVLTHANSGRVEPSLASWAEGRFGPLAQGPEPGRPGVVHRLDRETSGVIVLARTPAALLELKRQFKAREVAKTYAALVHGDPRFDSDWIEGELGRREGTDRVRIVSAGKGRAASTYYEVRERFRGAAHLALFPKTGRRHQLRVHMASVELPIVGESVYLPRRKQHKALPAGAPPMRRQALHAERLAFAHPDGGARVEYEAAWPADMRALLDWLRANAAQGTPS
jgi:23S rRNA pseudouridine1911/1915/1917 synthase